MLVTVLNGIMIPFVGTTLGSAMVFLLKNKISEYVKKILLGFASGVMIAASVWSLLIPAINMSIEQGKIGWIPASIGFLIGIIVLMFADKKIEQIENKKNNQTLMLVLAVTLHNIPEGMAIGVVFAGLLAKEVGISIASAFALAIGIAIQNVPEGAIISMPLKGEGLSKYKSFIYGMLSGIVEPIGAIITVVLTNYILPVLSYLLAFAAGAMIYVVSVELLPQINKGKYKEFGIISLAMGFIIMMILDVSLG